MVLPKKVTPRAVAVALVVVVGAAGSFVAVAMQGRDETRPTRPPAVPATAAGDHVAWVLEQVNDARTPSRAEIEKRFQPDFLNDVVRPEQLVQLLGDAAREHAPLSVLGFEELRGPSVVMATLRTRAGSRAALRLEVEPAPPARIVKLELGDAPPRVPTTGPYTGRFDIGGRSVFLRCVGSGSPTVVLEGGTTADWFPLQERLSADSRVCSHDRANASWARSDPAPMPRAAADVVSDLRATLTAARVPGPFVLAGHSNGGLFVQLYARSHPADVAGLVLIDGVHVDYVDRRLALIARLGGDPPPRAEYLDPEQKLLADRSIAQVRAAATARPLPRVPLEVLVHGVPSPDSAAAGSPERADAELWLELQRELTGLVPHGRMTIVDGAGHDIPADRPEAVVDAVRRVLGRPAK